jgi:cell wall-associated NlpC family hydrolase
MRVWAASWVLVLAACSTEPGIGKQSTSEAESASLAVQERPEPTSFVDASADSLDPSGAPTQPATAAARKLLELADEIDRTRTDTLYSHATKVRRKQGIYHFDCSGMMNWMLERAAPSALAKLGRERPVAASYVRVIEAAPTDRAKRGWQRVAHIDDVRPGDVFAWRRPADWPKGGNTGHVGIVLAQPEPVPEWPDAYVVRILDSTRYQHQYDSRGEGETGFGTGTILFMTDGAGQGIGYGWHGSASRGWFETPIVFGRLHK